MGQSWDEISEQCRQVLAIYSANAFASLFLLGSRFNHACIPNTVFAWNKTIEKGTFHAITDIATGEELTISYGEINIFPHSIRLFKLGRWGFTCTCPECQDTEEGRRKEMKRIQLSALAEDIAVRLKSDNSAAWKGAYDSAKEMVTIQRCEGLWDRMGIT
jgi:hypothetical protein